MISCIEGEVNITGNVIEIQADLVVLIRAIEKAFEKRLGTEKAKNLIDESIEMATKFRNIPLVEVEEKKIDPLSDKLEEDLKELEKLISKIREVKDNGSSK